MNTISKEKMMIILEGFTRHAMLEVLAKKQDIECEELQASYFDLAQLFNIPEAKLSDSEIHVVMAVIEAAIYHPNLDISQKANALYRDFSGLAEMFQKVEAAAANFPADRLGKPA